MIKRLGRNPLSFYWLIKRESKIKEKELKPRNFRLPFSFVG